MMFTEWYASEAHATYPDCMAPEELFPIFASRIGKKLIDDEAIEEYPFA